MTRVVPALTGLSHYGLFSPAIPSFLPC
jgi:hypothetical protein